MCGTICTRIESNINRLYSISILYEILRKGRGSTERRCRVTNVPTCEVPRIWRGGGWDGENRNMAVETLLGAICVSMSSERGTSRREILIFSIVPTDTWLMEVFGCAICRFCVRVPGCLLRHVPQLWIYEMYETNRSSTAGFRSLECICSLWKPEAREL